MFFDQKKLSDKQLAANRANAQLSSGPRSEEGKRRSSLNARRHNLTGQVTAMTEEDRIAHDTFSEALIKSMAPEGALEVQLAQRIATDCWRLNRSAPSKTTSSLSASPTTPATSTPTTRNSTPP